MKVPSCSVICCGSTLCVPMVVSEMSSVLRANSHIEGLFRKAGSQTRQKDIKVCFRSKIYIHLFCFMLYGICCVVSISILPLVAQHEILDM